METHFHKLHENISHEIKVMNTFSNSTNGTILEPSWRDDVKPILDYLMLVILIVVMLAMGCEVTWMSIWVHVKRPIGLVIGLVSQFGLKPVCAYLILMVSSIRGLHATGVVIIACCPGGVLSNTFTYFCDGDLGLSIAMTTASTVIAMGLMPANLWLYGRSFESEDLVIPYKEMALSLVSVTSPVVIGMILKWKVPTVAKWVAKVGSYFGLIIMFTCIAIELLIFPNMFNNVPVELYAIVVFLPIIGLLLGYFLAYIVRQKVAIRKTVAIECGVQNVPVALSIVAMSFPLEMQEDIVLLPWLYGFVMVLGCSVICLVYHGFKKRNERLAQKEKMETAVEENDVLSGQNKFIETKELKILPTASKTAIENDKNTNTV